MPKVSEAGSIVCTITVRNVRTKLQPQRRLDSYNFAAELDYGKNTGSKHQKIAQLFEQKFYGLFEQKKNHKAVSMVITLTQGLTLTILQAQSIRRLNCLDKSFLPRRDKTTTLKLLVYGLHIREL